MTKKKEILKKYTGKGGPINAAGIRQIQRDDENKLSAPTAKLPSPFQIIGSEVNRGISGAKALAGKAVGAVGSAAGKVLNSYENGFKRVDAAKQAQDAKWRQEAQTPRAAVMKEAVRKAIPNPMPVQKPLQNRMPLSAPKTMPAGISVPKDYKPGQRRRGYTDMA